jgi:single-strand DNA-binding protein
MNEITITGNLVNSPVLRIYGTQQVTKFRLAHTHSYRDPRTGDWTEKGTTFIDVTCWRNLAVNVSESVGKGSAVIVTGRLKANEWEKEVDGRKEKRTSFEIEATNVGPDLARGATRAIDVKSAPVSEQEHRAVDEALGSVPAGEVDVDASPFDPSPLVPQPYEPTPGEQMPAA